MKSFAGGLIFGVIIVFLCVFTCFAGGFAPVAIAAAPIPLEPMLARRALHARIGREMPKNAPITADEANYVAGAKIYRENCAVCHGLPGQPEGNISKGMFPDAPRLFSSSRLLRTEA